MHAEPQIKITQQQAQTGVCTLLRKYNQYVQRRTRALGSDGMDTSHKNDCADILRGLGFTNIRYDMFLVIVDSEYETWYAASSLTQATVKKAYKVRHPDIICEYKDHTYIVELDGKCHHDYDHDEDYDYLKIPYCKLNLEFLASEKITWRDWLKADMQKRGWLKRSTD